MKFQIPKQKIYNYALAIGIGSAVYLSLHATGTNWRIKQVAGLLTAYSVIALGDKGKTKKGSQKGSDDIPGTEQLNLDLASTEPAICVKYYTDKITKKDWEPSADVYLKRGASYQNLSQHENAIQDFEQAIEIDPLNFVAIAYKAASLGAIGRAKESLEQYEQALDMQPDNLSIRNSCGVMSFHNHDYQKAITYLDQVLDKYTSDDSVFYCRALCRNAVGDKKGAIEDFEQLKFENERLAFSFLAAGDLSHGNNDYLTAIEWYTKGISLIGNSFTNALYNRAVAYYNLNDFANSANDLSTAIQEGLDEYDSFYLRALCWFQLQEYAESLKDFDQALSLKPDETHLFLKIAKTYQASSRHEEAVDALNKFITSNPDDAEARQLKSISLNKLNKLSDALEDVDFCLMQNPNNIELLNMKKDILEKKGKLDDLKNIKSKILYLEGFLKIRDDNFQGAIDDWKQSSINGFQESLDALSLFHGVTDEDFAISKDIFLNQEAFVQAVLNEHIYIYITPSATSDEDSYAEAKKRIEGLNLMELKEEADIDSATFSEDHSQHSVENYLRTYGFKEGWQSLVISHELILRIGAARWGINIGEMPDKSPKQWAMIGYQILDELYHLCGGRNNMLKVIGSAINHFPESLQAFILTADETGSSPMDWVNKVSDNYRDFKKEVLVGLDRYISEPSQEFNWYVEDEFNAIKYANLLNQRVYELWKHTPWSKSGIECIKFLRSGDAIVNASWMHPDGEIESNRISESCLYFVYPDGTTVVREHNEYLMLSNEQHVMAAALTIISDVMGEYDQAEVSEKFYKTLTNPNSN
tara:strand:- start:634 stop:3075 length:2442 start_codon:yes stop_codon:yes gene_type:complete